MRGSAFNVHTKLITEKDAEKKGQEFSAWKWGILFPSFYRYQTLCASLL